MNTYFIIRLVDPQQSYQRRTVNLSWAEALRLVFRRSEELTKRFLLL